MAAFNLARRGRQHAPGGFVPIGHCKNYGLLRPPLHRLGYQVGPERGVASVERLSRIKMAIYAGTDKSAQVVFSFGERVKAALAGELKILSVGEVDLTLPSP